MPVAARASECGRRRRAEGWWSDGMSTDVDPPPAADGAGGHEFGVAVTDWLARLKDPDRGGDPEALQAELETAAEELRVADEELRAQQVEVARLLAEHQSVTAWHERLVANLPVPILTTDDQGLVTEANLAAGGFFGRSMVSLVRMPLTRFVADQDRPRLRSVISDLRDTDGEIRRLTATLRLPGDRTADVQIVASVDRASSARIRWIVVSGDTDYRGAEDPAQIGAHERISALMVARAFSQLWQMPLHHGDQQEILRSVAGICHEAFPDATWVSIILGSPEEPTMLAADSAEAQHLDGLQMLNRQGPCLDAWGLQVPVVSGALPGDTRWPEFAHGAADTGLQSVLAAPILLGSDKIGALNLYSTKPFAFLDAEVHICKWFASAVAAVLHDLRAHDELKTLAEQLENALASRGVIEQAKGVIMTHQHCGPDEAFAHLASLSSRSNLKLRDVARHVVEQAQRP